MVFWPVSQDTISIDLRTEFNNLIDGQGTFPGIGHFLIHRDIDKSQFCVCYNQTLGSSSDCQYCKGEGYVWTEKFIRAYFTQTFGRATDAITNAHILFPPGYFDHDKALCYSKYNSGVETGDILYRIRVNEEGSIYYPIERIEKWRITGVEDKRYELGKIAYYICLLEREEV